MHEFYNNGEKLLSTNYWQSPAAKQGECYLTWNKGTGRLLVPQSFIQLIEEIKRTKIVEIEYIQDGLQLFFTPAYTLANTALPSHPPCSLAQTRCHTRCQTLAHGIESKPTYPHITPLLSQCHFLTYPLSHHTQFAPSYLRIFGSS